MDRRAFIALGAAIGLPRRVHAQPTSGLPEPAAVREVLRKRIDEQKQSVGIVVGMIDASGRRVVSHGLTGKGGAPVDGRTVFEVGSISKVFTSLILSDMIQKGEVRLDQPVAELLPAGTKVPERGGRKITLLDLATHGSGLPRLPTNLAPKDLADPYADYGADKLYGFLAGYSLPRDIGARYEYSNLGVGLLGHALSLRAGQSYEALLKARVTGPLGMADTSLVLSPSQKGRLARGHDRFLDPVPNWDFDVLAGCGAVRSTANDMLKFLAAELEFTDGPLKAAMAAQKITSRPAPAPDRMALGWHVRPIKGGGELAWHNGGTYGYRAFTGIDLARRVGTVALSNAYTDVGMDDIGLHVLTASPAMIFKPPPTAIALDPARAAAWVGTYKATGADMVVTVDAGRLFAQISGQPRAEVFPSGPDEIFWKVVDAKAVFERDGAGKVARLVLYQSGAQIPWTRV